MIMILLTTARSFNNLGIAHAAPPGGTALPPQDVQIKMAEGLGIKGPFYVSSTGNPAPAVLLLHQYNGNRHQWDAFTNALTANGYNVLAVDQRGFGEMGGNLNWTLAEHDATDLMAWLREQPTVDLDKAAVVGAS